VLKICGRALRSASSSAARQNQVSIVFERRPRQDVAAVPVHHHDQVEKAAGHRDIRNVGGPYLVRPIDPHPAQQGV
jgi:hypothetical protein